jgi:hypothetical protein
MSRTKFALEVRHIVRKSYAHGARTSQGMSAHIRMSLLLLLAPSVTLPTHLIGGVPIIFQEQPRILPGNASYVLWFLNG